MLWACSTFTGTSRETATECMKSILATYILRERVQQYKAQGIDFSKHLYVPEYDKGEPFHNREDHGHLLKRITMCVRSGAVEECDMGR